MGGMATSISKETLEHLMALARLKLGRQEAASIAKDLQKIVEYVGELSRVDTEGVEPMAGGTELRNRMRDDAAPIDSWKEEDALLEAAPSREGRYVKAPRILE